MIVANGESGVVMDWGELTVVAATDWDTDALLSLRDDAARWLLARGIDQWQLGEIPYSWERGDEYFVFVLWHGENRVGTVTILWDDPVIWGEQPVPAGYVHNLIVARPFGGQGLGVGLLHWAENYVAESGRSLVRLDCDARSRKLPRPVRIGGLSLGASPAIQLVGARPGARALRKGLT